MIGSPSDSTEPDQATECLVNIPYMLDNVAPFKRKNKHTCIMITHSLNRLLENYNINDVKLVINW